jgi:hypothetical protein
MRADGCMRLAYDRSASRTHPPKFRNTVFLHETSSLGLL